MQAFDGFCVGYIDGQLYYLAWKATGGSKLYRSSDVLVARLTLRP